MVMTDDDDGSGQGLRMMMVRSRMMIWDLCWVLEGVWV